MADPIPHVVLERGDASDAPEGAVPIALFGAGSGGGGGPIAISDVTGLQPALNAKADDSDLDTTNQSVATKLSKSEFDTFAQQASADFDQLELAVNTNSNNLESTFARANEAYALADSKVSKADRAGLGVAGWANAVFIASGGTVPSGLPPYTLVIEQEA